MSERERGFFWLPKIAPADVDEEKGRKEEEEEETVPFSFCEAFSSSSLFFTCGEN